MITKETVLQEKVEKLLREKAVVTKSVLDKIMYDNANLDDAIIPLGEDSPISFIANGSIKMNIAGAEFSLHKNALGQLADKFGIPRKYMNSLTETQWGRDLLKHALVEHKNNIARNRVLVRTVGDEVRGILSDKYRRLNSDQIFGSFMRETQSQGAHIYEAQYGETKNYMSAILPTVIPIQTENNGIVHSVFGARISNSDFGDGALDVRAFQMNCVCLNGMVSETMLKQIHLGARLTDNIEYSDETYRLDTRTSASAIKDIIATVLSNDRITKTARTIQVASTTIVDPKKEIVKLQKMGMTKEEVSKVSDKLLNGSEEDGIVGAMSQWKMSQAINAVGNDIGGRRNRDLDELAGKFLKL